MKQTSKSLSPRAALFLGAALLSTPAFAQDVPAQTVTPPPIAIEPAAPAPAPVIQMAPASPVVQSVPAAREAQAPATAAPARAPRTSATARAAPVRAPAPVVQDAPAAPAAPAVDASAAVAAIGRGVASAATIEPVPALVPAEAPPAQVAQTDSGRVAWPWLLGGLALVLAGIAALLLTRRRRDELVPAEQYYAEPMAEAVMAPAYPEYAAVAQPEPVIDPIADHAPIAAPAMAFDTQPETQVEEAVSHAPDPDDLAGVVDTPAPVASRPWLEFGMRPVRAGTSEEEALVEFELTVGNSGDTPARDVRLTTFMLADGEGSEMERLLTDHRPDGDTVAPMTIPPGEGTRVDATLAVPKEGIGRMFNPVVVAEARYKLPGGREGRTAAAFRIGRPAGEGGLGPIGASRPHLVESVEAELVGTPEHA